MNLVHSPRGSWELSQDALAPEFLLLSKVSQEPNQQGLGVVKEKKGRGKKKRNTIISIYHS